MRGAWLRTLAVLAGIGLAATAFAQGPKQGGEQPPRMKQVRLTEKQVQGFLAVQKDLAPLSKRIEAQGERPDPALQAQVEQIARKNGFSSLEELDTVGANVGLVLSGLDPQSGAFTEPPEQIRQDMEQVRQDKQMPKKDKDQALAEMQQALKSAAPLQYRENIALVKKYQRQLEQAMPQEPGQGGR